MANDEWILWTEKETEDGNFYIAKQAFKEACACIGSKAWNWLDGDKKREEYLHKKTLKAVGAWVVDADMDEEEDE